MRVPFFFLTLFNLLCSQAGILGRFDHIKNVPGYLEFDDPSSPIYNAEKVLKLEDNPSSDGIERRSPSRILREDYLYRNGSINTASVQRKIAEVNRFMMNAFLLYCGDKGHVNCQSQFYNGRSKKPYRSWKNKKIGVAGSFVISELNRALELSSDLNMLEVAPANTQRVQDFLAALFQGLETFAAMKGEQEDYTGGNAKRALKTLKNILTRVEIRDSVDAVNLDIPAGEQIPSFAGFYHPEELRKAGYDLSRYDPVESGFWRRPQAPISEFDTGNYSNQLKTAFGAAKFAQLVDIQNPNIVIDVNYEEPMSGGTTPKMEVTYQGFKMKMKFGIVERPLDEAGNILEMFHLLHDASFGETRTEFVANNLAAALGYTVDPTYFKKEARLFLSDHFDSELSNTPEGRDELLRRFIVAREKMVNELTQGASNVIPTGEEAYKWRFIPFMRDYGIVESGAQKGRHFISMQSVSLEFKRQIDVDYKVGLFHKYAFGKYLKREFRAFMLFYMWLSDVDIKDDNTSLGLVQVGSQNGAADRKKVYYSATDMGGTLGGVPGMGKGRPNSLGYDLVNEQESRSYWFIRGRVIVLNGVSSYQSPMFKAMNFSDAKWIVRMMAQLTKEQIKRPFLVVDYPEVVAELYTQKLLRRRDQLVRALGLDEERILTHGSSPRMVEISGHTSDIVDPGSYFVPSCKECFDSGELVRFSTGEEGDENLLHSIKVFPDGSTQKKFLGALSKLLVASGIRIIGQRLQRHKIEGITFHGVRLDVNTFLPARYILENPYPEDTANRFWIVDVFRVGIGQGYEHMGAELGLLAVNDSARLRYGAGATEVFEFIKAKPVSHSHSYGLEGLSEIYHPRNMIAQPLSGMKESFIDDLEEGDLIISSQYLTLGAGAGTHMGFSTSGLGAQARVIVSTAARVTLFKETADKVTAVWSDISGSSVKAGAFFDYMLGDFFLLGGQYDKREEERKVYSFDLSHPDEKKILSDNIAQSDPGDIPQEYAVETAHIEQSIKQFVASFFDLATFRRGSKTTYAKLSDADENLLKDIVIAERESSQSELSLVSFVDRISGTMMGKIDMDYMKSYATRKDYMRMVDEFKGVLPEVMVQFAPDSVNYHLGRLDFKAQLLFSDAALRDILSQSIDKMTVCQAFARYGRLRWVEDGDLSTQGEIDHFCGRIMSGELNRFSVQTIHSRHLARAKRIVFGVLDFMDDLARAQKRLAEFEGLLQQGDDATGEASRHLANAVADLLQGGSAKDLTHLAIISLTSADKIYREVEINSDLEGFPGQVSRILLHAKQRGGRELRDMPLWDINHPLELLEMSVEPAFTALAPLFYSGYWLYGIEPVGLPGSDTHILVGDNIGEIIGIR